ncbi:MAG TPA: hypothetical protein VN414_09175 [Methanosarcina sp.]|nr:hypothetical protein [Methanosarcina sp.]
MTVNTVIKPSDKKAKDAAYFSKIIRQHLPKLTQEYNISYLEFLVLTRLRRFLTITVFRQYQ